MRLAAMAVTADLPLAATLRAATVQTAAMRMQPSQRPRAVTAVMAATPTVTSQTAVMAARVETQPQSTETQTAATAATAESATEMMLPKVVTVALVVTPTR